MKKESNKLKENLVNSDFSVKGECAISLILTKLDIINIELSMILDRNVIQMKTGRMKSYESTCKKMKNKGLEKNFSNALEKINDLIGVRAIGFQGGTQWMKAELQLRTAAMDYWANLDHQLRYKRGRKEAEVIDEELRACSDIIGTLDRKMLEIRKKIDKI